MSDQELRDKLASDERLCAAEEWPLSKNWWLHIQSCPGEKPFEAFDFIKVEAHGPNEYRRPITSIMVPKIDGFVCQSHSFIAGLIHQNIKAVEQERDQLRAEVERLSAENKHLRTNVLNPLIVNDMDENIRLKAQCEKLAAALQLIQDFLDYQSNEIEKQVIVVCKQKLAEYRKSQK